MSISVLVLILPAVTLNHTLVTLFDYTNQFPFSRLEGCSFYGSDYVTPLIMLSTFPSVTSSVDKNCICHTVQHITSERRSWYNEITMDAILVKYFGLTALLLSAQLVAESSGILTLFNNLLKPLNN